MRGLKPINHTNILGWIHSQIRLKPNLADLVFSGSYKHSVTENRSKIPIDEIFTIILYIHLSTN